MSRIFPSFEQIKQLKPPPTDGEKALLEYLDNFLSNDWEIYFQPNLNGDKPDIAILNESIGLMIIEVKDWNLIHYCTKETKFFNKKINKEIKFNKFFVKQNGKDHQIASPVQQVERYINNLIGVYLPQIGDKVDEKLQYNLPFKTGLYFHNSSTEDAQKFIGKHTIRCSIFGNDLLAQGSKTLNKIVQDIEIKKSIYMKKDWSEKIRFWLKPPFHSLEQGQKINLTSKQFASSQPSPNKHQKLRGVAGSGKTLVIAQRAANLASLGKKVLIVSFNITLWHYIKDHIQRARYGFDWSMFEFNHFHGFCKNFLNENDQPWPANQDNEEEFFKKIIPEKVLNILKKGMNKKNRKYDAILIDEGQDFDITWYHMLSEFLTANNELLLVIDETQNIYNMDNSWVESNKGTQFRGRTRFLNENLRMPVNIVEQVNKFSRIFLQNQNYNIESQKITSMDKQQLRLTKITDVLLIWRNISSFDEASEKIFLAFSWLTKKKVTHPQDIIILVPTHKEGIKLLDMFNKKLKVNINHVFDINNDGNKTNKKSFWMGDSRLKISTIHSFKGWELNNVIVITPSKEENLSELDNLIYTSITRTRQRMIILNRLEKYNEYGLGWKKFEKSNL